MQNLNTTVLIIEDDKSFSDQMSYWLTSKGYTVSCVYNMDAALHFMATNTPDFVFSDRMVEGEFIENTYLQQIKDNALLDCFIIVYTRVDELTKDDILNILDNGAIRVINKSKAEKLVDDIEILTTEFERLRTLSNELEAITNERSKLVAALVGTYTGVSVIDQTYYCWFANPFMQKIAGNNCVGCFCWNKLHNHPIYFGPCWGCIVREVFKNKVAIDKLQLTRYAQGKLRWISVRAAPIFDDKKEEVIAVRKAVSIDTKALVDNMSSETRLQKIAEGIVHAGFGRARIFRLIQNGTQLKLVAAAARTNNFFASNSEYFEKLKNRKEIFSIDDIEEYKIVYQKKVGVFFTKEDEKEINFAFPPPKFLFCIWGSDHNIPMGLLGVDFEGYEAFKNSIYSVDKLKAFEYLGREDRTRWFNAYLNEIRYAFESVGNVELHKLYDAVQSAKLGIAGANSVYDAIDALLEAIKEIVPNNCDIFIRLAKETCYERYEALSIGPNVNNIPIYLEITDSKSLSIYAIENRKALWINDYQNYKSTANDSQPLGYSDQSVKSIARIPLKYEEIIFGSLNIDSHEVIDWDKTTIKAPLRELAKFAALVIRDVTLSNEAKKAKSELAAMIAFASASSHDKIWKHEVDHRLAELDAEITLARNEVLDKGITYAHDQLNVIKNTLNRIRSRRPLKQIQGDASINEILAEIVDYYRKKGFKLDVELGYNVPRVKIPGFILRQIIVILVDNSFRAIEEARKGGTVKISVKLNQSFINIQVQDDGPGIPPSLKDKILNENVESKDGQGVGLLYARGAALQYGGELSFLKEEINTTFLLQLIPTT